MACLFLLEITKGVQDLHGGVLVGADVVYVVTALHAEQWVIYLVAQHTGTLRFSLLHLSHMMRTYRWVRWIVE